MDKPSKRLRIIINTNAPWGTSGYSQQAAEIIPRIEALGYPLAVIDFYGLMGGMIQLDNVLHYPSINQVYGSDAMVLHGRDFKADVTISLQDVFTLPHEHLRDITRWIPMCPVDHDPVPPAVLERLRMAYRVITYSQHGSKLVKEAGIHNTYIPHTVNTQVFVPFTTEERNMIRASVGIKPENYVFGMVAANRDFPSRKSFQEVMDAFAVFVKKHPHARLYLHSSTDIQTGFPIKQYAKFLGISQYILMPDMYQMAYKMPKGFMPRVYNMFDCLLSPSAGEGFGVPIIEAQSCGVPVIATDYTAMSELVIEGKTGYLCDVLHKRFDAQFSYAAIPDPKSIYTNMELVYNSARHKMSRRAREHIVDKYDSDKVFNAQWAPYLQKLEDEIYGTI